MKSPLDRNAVDLRPDDPDGEIARWCLGEYYRELGLCFENGFDPGEKSYSGAGKAQPSRVHFVLAWRGREAVGCGSLIWADNIVGEIKRMWVAPAARGLGIARRLLRHLEDQARAEGLKHVRLDTNRVLISAQALYRSAGYADIPRYSDNPYAHHWFGKAL